MNDDDFLKLTKMERIETMRLALETLAKVKKILFLSLRFSNRF